MIKNYFRVAFRNLWRHKAYSAINIVGLALGLTTFLLILMYVRFELSYDNFHKNGNRIYRLNVDIRSTSDVTKFRWSSCPMGPAIKADFPEVESFARIGTGELTVKVNHELFKEDRFFVADPSLFTMFSFPVVKGSTKELEKPYTVVLTESTAKKYFGSQDPIGKMIMVEASNDFKVVAVVKDIPANSQFKFDLVYSFATTKEWTPTRLSAWGYMNNMTLILLRPGADEKALEGKFPSFLKRHIDEKARADGQDYIFHLEALKDIYMDSRGGIEQGTPRNVYLFSIIALFILLIAAVNFVNLTTARSTERAKEVGVRKVVGAIREQLAIQFLGESLILASISFVLAALLTAILIQPFNTIAGKPVSDGIFHGSTLFLLLAVSLVIGLVAGLYPALAISSFKPVLVLKGRFSASVQGINLRKALVVFQFGISIILIIGAFVIYEQLRFMRTQPLGFQTNQLLNASIGWDPSVQKNYHHIENEFQSLSNISGVAFCDDVPGADEMGMAHLKLENKSGHIQEMNTREIGIGYNFLSLYEIQIVAGRGFSKVYPDDTLASIIVNEAAAKSLGYASPADIIGKRFALGGRKIIGVVKDFHYKSLATKIEPLFLYLDPIGMNITFKISSRNIPATLAAIRAKWKVLIPDKAFNYSFLDGNINKLYAAEEQFEKLFFYFAAFAIFISCLGLLGLASYSILQRTREIGIRKVLGASVSGIVTLLSRQFLQLVLFSLFVAFPVAWYGMHKWLEGYAYHIQSTWWIFVVSGALALITALLTIGYQATRAALANPIKSLKSE